jgi:hypothetical protein
MITDYGNICNNQSKYYNSDSNKCLCGTHNNVVKKVFKKWKSLLVVNTTCPVKTGKKLYKEYKQICKSSRRCNDKFSNKQLLEMINLLETCHRKRIQFTENCYKNIGDTGHKIEIENVQKAINNCHKVLSKRSK